MDKLQVVFFFISGYVVSRLLVCSGAPQQAAAALLGRGQTSLGLVVLRLIALTAGLSFFIPNSVTVLTLLPVVALIRQSLALEGPKAAQGATLLALSVIYGANIGGLGSLTGTPANGILLAFLEAKEVPGAAQVQFATWLLWGVPLVVLLVVLAWLVLLVCLRPGRLVPAGASLEFHAPEPDWRRLGWALGLTGFYLASSLALSFWMLSRAQDPGPVLWATAGVSVVLWALAFGPVMPSCRGCRRLLKPSDLLSGLPRRGLIWMAGATLLAAALFGLGGGHILTSWLGAHLPQGDGLWVLLFVVATATSFATEVLSNTAVQLALFLLLEPWAAATGFPVLKLLLVVTLSCTCAFMSPIATGVNGLAFGEVRGARLSSMLKVGTLMNLTAAAVIASWVAWLIPW